MMEPEPRCLGSIFVSIYRVTKGRDCNRSTQVFELFTDPIERRKGLEQKNRNPGFWTKIQIST